MTIKAPTVRIEPWSEDDFDLLRAANAPEMMDQLGGPETEEQLINRHRRYVDLSADRTGKGRMFRIVLLSSGRAAGTIGFWEQTWNGERVYETGWSVLPGFQGHGVATAGTSAVVEVARAERKHRYLHAFPSVTNGPSNAVCRKAGFDLVGECDFAYPPGQIHRSNDWRLDLQATPRDRD
ncbi:GNAT family N-acetyltransferase [Streptomyces lunaelactis]|uniref:GNAT family N-acetyltransferase n=1 Tax=Streptomyces lunaelactis TaxID=1535768 RepID=UPI0015855D5E|nr:GNAT family N-acetyltransferase [Streptomyces lunaelactis]NUK25584.1 GNAT family N-acetyltransferase [Streptomyces lunaelactis]NUK54196.1 GNAT family N-acetyltransferase [Streptomyces lunaelactis]NUK60359.1 GNAT family N-acetyltransferase [Streptomyces lunaelactis]NUK67015.1 GNAT family N-acetyltransferase [Streptomyces lunaelactis]NUK74403.1 GNAT family N-acetyltransferase [Streptomyces lunaelactis]